jgi:hypothetical protein
MDWNDATRRVYAYASDALFSVHLDDEGGFGPPRVTPADPPPPWRTRFAVPGQPLLFFAGMLLDEATHDAVARFEGAGVRVGGVLLAFGYSGLTSFDDAFVETASAPMEGVESFVFPFGSKVLAVKRPYSSARPSVRVFDPLDLDEDGVPLGADAFPSDPLEWSDRDGDRVGDNGDPFPDDPSEWEDTDGDGVGDNTDAFRYDATEWADSDGDHVGDNSDDFPLDPRESEDEDHDGIPDHADPYPYGEPFLGVALAGAERTSVGRMGSLTFALPEATLGLLPGGRYSLCYERNYAQRCLVGTHAALDRRGRRFALTLPQDWLDAAPEEIVDRAHNIVAERATQAPFSIDVAVAEADVELRVTVNRNGTRAKLSLQVPYTAVVEGDGHPKRTVRGTWKWRYSAPPVPPSP